MIEKLFNLAKKQLLIIDEKVSGLPEPQVTVLFTNKENYYVAINDIDGLICNELRAKKDTKIVNMLTMWKSGHIDLPSIKFRKALVQLDVFNYDTNMILQGKEGCFSKKISVTIHSYEEN